jgi:hypothetical protein
MSSQDWIKDSKDTKLMYIVSHYSQIIRLAKTIIFPKEFNGSEIIDIPEGVKHIEIRKVRYIQKVIRLPDSLRILRLDCWFEKIKLPDSLEYLELGPNSKGVIYQWPKSLKILSICDSGIDYLPRLPDSLEYLRLDITSDCKLSYQWTGLPKSLKTLIVPSQFFTSVKRVLWLKDLNNLKHLEFEGYLLSASATSAIIRNLPSGLKTLEGLYVSPPNDIMCQFPDSLEYLTGDFNYKGTLPKSLKVFYCPSCEISSPLPKSLQYLNVSSVEGQGLKALSRLPNLKTLICDRYNPSYERNVSFPSSLQHLQIKSSAFNITSFPSNLKTLTIPRSALSAGIRLPEKLESLTLTNCGFTSYTRVTSGLKVTYQ